MTDGPFSDEACVARVQGGDSEAFGLLATRYGSRLHRWIIPITQDSSDAEDVVQEAMLKAYLHIQSFHGQSSFATWLYRIAYNMAISRQRKENTRPPNIPLDEAWAADEPDEPDDADFDGFTPEDLKKALQLLPPKDRVLLTLYYAEERSVADLVQITGMSASNIKVRLFRLRNKLKKLMTKNETK